MKNEIVRFEYNNKWYFIGLADNDKYDFLIKEDDKVISNVSMEDKQILTKIIDGLIVNPEKSIDLGIRKVDNALFNVFFDERTGLYYWYKVVDGKLVEANEEENSRLNFKYNHISSILQVQKSKDKNSSNEKRARLKVGNVIVYLTAAFCLGYIAQNHINKFGFSGERDKLQTRRAIASENYNPNQVITAIEKNPYLNDEEENLLKNLQFVFDENHQYMNYDLLLDKLETLQIEYTFDSKKLDEGIAGEYHRFSNVISMYDAENYEGTSKSCLVHELMHVIQTYEFKTSFFMELSNENATREAVRRLYDAGLLQVDERYIDAYGRVSRYGEGYDEYMPIYYWVAECLTQEQLKDFQFYPDDQILVDALVKLDNPYNKPEKMLDSKSRAMKLIQDIDDIKDYNPITQTSEYNLEIDEYRSIYDQTAYYYYKAHARHMDECMAIEMQDYDVKMFLDSTVEKLESGKGYFTMDLETSTKGAAVRRAVFSLSGADSEYTTVNFTGTYLAKSANYIPRSYLSDNYKYAQINLLYWNHIKNTTVELNENANYLLAEYLKEERLKDNIDYDL